METNLVIIIGDNQLELKSVALEFEKTRFWKNPFKKIHLIYTKEDPFLSIDSVVEEIISKKPTLIISDYGLHNFNARELLAKFKEKNFFPLFLCKTIDTLEAKKQLYSDISIIVKPITKEKLNQYIKEIIK